MTKQRAVWQYVAACGMVTRYDLDTQFPNSGRTFAELVRQSLLGTQGNCYFARRIVQEQNPWTAADDAVIREVYPRGGVLATMERLPGRTKQAIQKRANKLGVQSLTPLRRSMTRGQRREQDMNRAFARLPAFTVGHIGPLVRCPIGEAA